MLELLTIVLCYGLDFLTKQLAASQLIYAVGGVPLIGDSVMLYYAENHGDNTSVIRGNNAVGLVLRLLLLAAALYLILAQRKKLRPITRFALGMLVAGVLGNQIDYLLRGYVIDMIDLPVLGGAVFNVADFFVIIAFVVLMVRLLFFEGRTFVDWLYAKITKKPAEEQTPPQAPAGQPEEKGQAPGRQEDAQSQEPPRP